DVYKRQVQRQLEQHLPDIEIRSCVLGHLVRGGAPSFFDRMIASRLGFAALQALLDGAKSEMVAWQAPIPGGLPTGDRSVTRWPLERVIEESKALLDGTSPVAQARIRLMEAVAKVLAL
ncbi:MAG: 6-phosphofructokinase, partial [Deltaproteobacteria bacterium]|nr:6-phosphofructokinase [Deltaproteobacteria bacterium]